MKRLKQVFILMGLGLWCTTSQASVFEKAAQSFKEAVISSQGIKQKAVLSLYQKNNFQPLWFTPEGWLERRDVAWTVLKQAEGEGLNPEEYAYGWKEVSDLDEKEISQADINLTRAMIDYMEDIKGNRFNPAKINKDIHYKSSSFDAATALYEGLHQDPKATFLSSFTLKHPAYQKLKALLKTLKDNQPADVTQQFAKILGGKLLKKGMSHPQLSLIRARLGLPEAGEFDQAMEQAVKDFQQRNGIESDGAIGERTLGVLNKTPQDRINQVLATMEKWRWIPETLEDRYVIVNIPAFKLTAYHEGKPPLEMKVIVGKTYRHTPLFASVINEVRFNPSWYVPRNIAVKDKLKMIQNNPSYLSQKGFKVYDQGGSVVEPNTIDWSNLHEGHFPYKLVQGPGSANALGKIRFNIISNFDIYLHSTSDPQLFDKEVRSFSSGCIRIEKPDAMGVYVLNDAEKWPLEAVQKAMEGTQTQNIHLKKPIPIFITYLTVWFNDKGDAVFADDIYDQDQWLIKAMKEKNHYAVIK